jgi:hypothetical protein
LAAWLVVSSVSLAPRLMFAGRFPTCPVSDFRSVVDLSTIMQDSIFARGAWHWQYFNPGLPLLLSLLHRISPLDPDSTARLATVVGMGLVPLIPIFVLRPVVTLRWRMLLGLLLALHPGAVGFSTVVAQDNWVTLPIVALCCTAMRVLFGSGKGKPVLAGLLYVVAFFIRQEMLLVLIPLTLGAAIGRVRAGALRTRNVAVLGSVVLPALLFGIMHRGIATGRFALTTEHSGTAMLGAYVPGTGRNHWTDPLPFVASEAPELLDNPTMLQPGAFRLAIRELMRRPWFHTIRVVAAVLEDLRRVDSANLYWSLGHPEVLPVEKHADAAKFGRRFRSFFDNWLVGLHILFLAAMWVLIESRQRVLLGLAVSTIGLKIAIHALSVSQPRFFVPIVALEYLFLGFAAREIVQNAFSRVRIIRSMAIGGLLFGLLACTHSATESWFLQHDVDHQRLYRFQVPIQGGNGEAVSCILDEGRLTQLAPTVRFTMRNRDPQPNERVHLQCDVPPRAGGGSVHIGILDEYEHGDVPGRVVQRVHVDDHEVLVHDIGKRAGTGWNNVQLLGSEATNKVQVDIEVRAVAPDPGAAWGQASTSALRFTSVVP